MGCEAGCAVVIDGTCTACTTTITDDCTDVTCATNKFDTNDDATDGCEAGCAIVTDGTCTACTTAVASGCTAVTCAPGYHTFVDGVGCSANACPCPNGTPAVATGSAGT